MSPCEHTHDDAIDDFAISNDRLPNFRAQFVDALSKECHLLAYGLDIHCRRLRWVQGRHCPSRGRMSWKYLLM